MSSTEMKIRINYDEEYVYLVTELEDENDPNSDAIIGVAGQAVMYLNSKTGRFGMYEFDSIDAAELNSEGIATEEVSPGAYQVQFEEDYSPEDDGEKLKIVA